MSGRLEDAAHGASSNGERNLLPVALTVAILAIATSSLFVRYAQRDTSSIVIAAARLVFATLFFAPIALLRFRDDLRAWTRRDLGLGLLAGVFLALHFATWITSLERTSVVSSVVLVTTSPLWVALLSPWLLKERLTARVGLGVLLALAGSVVIGFGDAGGSTDGSRRNSITGDFLALAGAWAMAGYLMIGRRLRVRTRLVPYLFLVYGMGALVLVVWALLSGATLSGVRPPTVGWLVLLALLPQVVGHSTFNWALKDLPAAVVSVALLGEPIASAVLAYLFLGERPGALTLIGAAVILCGLTVAATAPRGDGARSASTSRR